MAGRPQQFERLCRRIEELGGEDWLFEQLSLPRTIKQIAEELDVSRHAFYKWVKLDPARHQRFLDFGPERADALADSAVDITDGANENVASSVQHARNRAEMRKWLAGTLSEKYATKSGAQVQVNIGSLHLDALKAKGAAPALPGVAVEVVDTADQSAALPPSAPTLADLM